MTMPKIAKSEAELILARLDKLAGYIQKNASAWGIPFDDAKGMVNDLDRTADEIETAAFGVESFQTRQAEVIQKESDEPYMATFENPQSPHQVEADEPYMSAYSSDDSSGVNHGKSENGKPLTPNN